MGIEMMDVVIFSTVEVVEVMLEEIVDENKRRSDDRNTQLFSDSFDRNKVEVKV